MNKLIDAVIALTLLLPTGCALEQADRDLETQQEALDSKFFSPICPHKLTPCTDEATCQGHLVFESRMAVPYWRTHALSTYNADVSRAVIVLHGMKRNAAGYFEDMVAAAEKAGGKGADLCAATDTIILAPKFQMAADNPRPFEVWWDTSDGWEQGDAARYTDLSSYDVVDGMVRALADQNQFPNLRTIEIVGHSGGGQFAQRYAAGNRVDGTLRPELTMSYVVTNPSSYMYLNELRPSEDGTRFDTAAKERCASYDDYKFGLVGLNDYMATTGESTILGQYPKRNVTYLLGLADTGSDQLDTNCEANAQGANRLERGRNFVRFMDTYFGGHAHQEVDVPGVGHQPGRMWGSAEGLRVLFAN